MVDEGAKADTLDLLVAGGAAKGYVLAVARPAGTWRPRKRDHAGPSPASDQHCGREGARPAGLLIEARVTTAGKTGVKREALAAVSVADPMVYDMLKAVDRSMSIERIRLVEKTGGRMGTYRREGEDPWPG